MGGEQSKSKMRSNSLDLAAGSAVKKTSSDGFFGGSLKLHRPKSRKYRGSDLRKLQNRFDSKKESEPASVPILGAVSSELTLEQQHQIEANRVFGVSFQLAVERSDPKGLVPAPISTCIKFLQPDHVELVGIYRISGSMSVIKEYVLKFDLGEEVVFPKDIDPHVVSGVLKYFLRELPESIFTDDLHSEFKDIQDIPPRDVEKRIEAVRELLPYLPKSNCTTLRILIEHAKELAAHSDTNKMTAANLGLVLSPAFVSLFTTMIENCAAVFDDLPEKEPRVVKRRISAPVSAGRVSIHHHSTDFSAPSPKQRRSTSNRRDGGGEKKRSPKHASTRSPRSSSRPKTIVNLQPIYADHSNSSNPGSPARSSRDRAHSARASRSPKSPCPRRSTGSASARPSRDKNSPAAKRDDKKKQKDSSSSTGSPSGSKLVPPNSSSPSPNSSRNSTNGSSAKAFARNKSSKGLRSVGQPKSGFMKVSSDPDASIPRLAKVKSSSSMKRASFAAGSSSPDARQRLKEFYAKRAGSS